MKLPKVPVDVTIEEFLDDEHVSSSSTDLILGKKMASMLQKVETARQFIHDQSHQH
jgi:hypothetical protein